VLSNEQLVEFYKILEKNRLLSFYGSEIYIKDVEIPLNYIHIEEEAEPETKNHENQADNVYTNLLYDDLVC